MLVDTAILPSLALMLILRLREYDASIKWARKEKRVQIIVYVLYRQHRKYLYMRIGDAGQCYMLEDHTGQHRGEVTSRTLG